MANVVYCPECGSNKVRIKFDRNAGFYEYECKKCGEKWDEGEEID